MHDRATRSLPLGTMVVVIALWLATVGNIALWTELAHLDALQGARGWGFALGFGVMIAAACVALLSFLAWKPLIKYWISLWVLAAAFGAHYMLSYHVVIDTSMLTNVVQTDVKEVRDLLSWRLFVTVGLIAGLPLWWVWRTPLISRGFAGQLWRNVVMLALAIVVIACSVWLTFQDFSSTMRNHKHVRFLLNPLNSAFAVLDLGVLQRNKISNVIQPIGQSAHLGSTYATAQKPPLFVFVVGETARAKNFGINGYDRATTPQLQNLLSQGQLFNFRQARSCGTSTAASLPCMFSHLGKEGFASRSSEYENLLDVLARAGLAVLWIDNQSGCKGLCERVAHVDTSESAHPTWCAGGECLDEVMLDKLDERIAALPADKRAKGVVLVMHQMGSHGPAYFKRSPPDSKPFMPECTSINLQDCVRSDVLNAYDNSIVYTDRFLARAAAWLQSREASYQTAMLYVSDHGESLGEGNLYLHGLPYALAPDEQKHVPLVLWLSRGFEQRVQLRKDCLKAKTDVALTHDNLFHTLLGLMDVQTSEYQATLDFSQDCRVTR